MSFHCMRKASGGYLVDRTGHLFSRIRYSLRRPFKSSHAGLCFSPTGSHPTRGVLRLASCAILRGGGDSPSVFTVTPCFSDYFVDKTQKKQHRNRLDACIPANKHTNKTVLEYLSTKKVLRLRALHHRRGTRPSRSSSFRWVCRLQTRTNTCRPKIAGIYNGLRSRASRRRGGPQVLLIFNENERVWGIASLSRPQPNALHASEKRSKLRLIESVLPGTPGALRLPAGGSIVGGHRRSLTCLDNEGFGTSLRKGSKGSRLLVVSMCCNGQEEIGGGKKRRSTQ